MSITTDFLKGLNKPLIREEGAKPENTAVSAAANTRPGASAGAPVQDVTPQTSREKANAAAKELEVYRTSEEYRAKQQEQNRQRMTDELLLRMMTGSADTFGPELQENETENQLAQQADYWKQQADREDREAETAALRQTLKAMTAEEQQLLEQYNEERRQNFVTSLNQSLTGAVDYENNPLIQRYGRQQLDRLADLYTDEKNREAYLAAQQRGIQDADNGRAFMGSVDSVAGNLAASLLSPLSRIADSRGRIGDNLSAYSAGDALYGYSAGLRGEVARNISGDEYDENGEKVKDGGLARQLAAYAYQGGMSAADSGARLLVGGSGAVGAGLAAMGSFNQTLSEATEMGAAPGQAMALAAATAGIEALSEKLPLDNLMDIVTTGGRGALMNIAKQMLTEVGEEEISFIAGLVAEAAILRDKSGYNQEVQRLMATGMTEQEARQKAAWGLVKEAGETALVSAISGGISAGGAQIGHEVAGKLGGMLDQAQAEAGAEAQTEAEVGQSAAKTNAVSNPIVNPDIKSAPAVDTSGKTAPEGQVRQNDGGKRDGLDAVLEKTLTGKPQPDQPADGGQDIKGTVAAEQNFSGKAEYQQLLYDGNVQPDRPGDVRPMEVPKTDAGGKHVTEFAANAYGAEVTTDEMAGEIERLIQDGELSFDVRTNEQSLRKAMQTMKDKGATAVREQISRNIGKGKIRDGDIETAILLYSTYARKGKTDKASEMLVDLAEMANITGRNLQLFKLLRRMTVEGQVMTLQKEVRRNVEKMISGGQVKAGYEPSFDPTLMDNYRRALERLRVAKSAQEQAEAEAEAKQAQDAIYLAEAAKMPATFRAKWDAWRYMAMLGNAKTQIRNFGGNMAFAPYKVVKDNMAAAAERIFLKQENRTKSFLNPAAQADRELLRWAAEDGKSGAVQDALKYSAKLGDDVSTAKLQDAKKVFDTGALETVRKAVEKLPRKGDMFFKNPYYATALAGFVKARGYTAEAVRTGAVPEAVMTEARTYAIQEAMKATFNDCNSFSDFISNLRYKGENPWGKAANILLEGVLPFRRTPANIVVRFAEYSPVGILKGIGDMATKVRNGDMSAATAIDQIASGLTGTAAMGLGWLLASGAAGVKLTGSGLEEEEKRQGHQEYALEFSLDGQEYSYKIDWAAPANLPLFVGANVYGLINGQGKDESLSAFTSFVYGMGNMFEPMLALSCLSSLNDIFEAGKYSDGNAVYSVLAQAATSYLTQGIPALLRQGYQASQEVKQKTFANSADPLIRDLQRRAANIPIVGAAFQTDSIDTWGEEESRGSAGRRIFDAFFNPGTGKTIDGSDLEKELSRLGDAQEENINPPEPAKIVNGLRLTEEQYNTLAKVQGQTAKTVLEELFASGAYEAMTDQQKAAAVRKVYDYAREMGRKEAIDGYRIGEKWMDGIAGREAPDIALNIRLEGVTTNLGKAGVILESSGMTEAEKEMYLKRNLTAAQGENIDEVQALGFDLEVYAYALEMYDTFTKGDGKKERTVEKMMEDLGIDEETAGALYDIFK